MPEPASSDLPFPPNQPVPPTTPKLLRSSNIPKNTPRQLTSNAEKHKKNMNINEIKAYLKEELRDPVNADLAFPEKAFSYLNDGEWPDRIKQFFEETKPHDGKRWTAIPESPSYEKNLYKPLDSLLQTVREYFKLEDRQVKDTSSVFLSHLRKTQPMLYAIWGKPENELTADDTKKLWELEMQTNKTAPDISIFGKGGPCFQSTQFPSNPDERNYVNIVCPLEVKLESNSNLGKHLLQVAIYARECFVEQHNRKHVYSAVLTEKTITLFQFNRSMVVRSPKINYHDSPELFIKIILGLFAADEKELELAFDQSIFWTTSEGTRIRKIVLPFYGEPQEFDLENFAPRWISHTIIGRGTTCWEVVIDGVPYLVKDIWRAVHREAESTFLVEVKGLKGLCQMHSYKRHGRVFENESLSGVSLQNNQRDRALCRLIFERYGKSLEHFDCLITLLEAFLDAICAHQRLLAKLILHRDISLNNVLYGTSTKPGFRGILIDLDLAIFLDRPTSGAEHDYLTGTQAFLSYKALTNPHYPHDFKDDLESFFYVLLWILLSRKANGKRVECFPELLDTWRHDKATICGHAKSDMIMFFDTTALPLLQHGQIIRSLLDNLAKFIWTTNIADSDRRRALDEERFPTLASLHPKDETDKVYNQFMGYIEDAIKELKRNGGVDIPVEVKGGQGKDSLNIPSSSTNASNPPPPNQSTSSHISQPPLASTSTLRAKRTASSREPGGSGVPDSPPKRLKMLSGEAAPRRSASDDQQESADAGSGAVAAAVPGSSTVTTLDDIFGPSPGKLEVPLPQGVHSREYSGDV